MENKGADDEKGAPTNTGGGFQYQIHPKFVPPIHPEHPYFPWDLPLFATILMEHGLCNSPSTASHTFKRPPRLPN